MAAQGPSMCCCATPTSQNASANEALGQAIDPHREVALALMKMVLKMEWCNHRQLPRNASMLACVKGKRQDPTPLSVAIPWFTHIPNRRALFVYVCSTPSSPW